MTAVLDQPGALILKLGQTAKGTQVCQACGRGKPLSEFPRHHKSRTGIGRICDDCDREKRAVAGRKRAATFAAKRELKRVAPEVRPPDPQAAAQLRRLIIEMRIHALDRIDPATAKFATRLEEILNGS